MVVQSENAVTEFDANRHGKRFVTPFATALSFVAPLSIDAVLPSFWQISHEFNVQVSDVQIILGSYLFAYGIMSLWHGVLTDAYGRRQIAIASLVIYVAASAACFFASSILSLAAARFIQGSVSGAGIVVGRAMIRDQFSGQEAQRRLSIISMMLSLPPALGPVLGGWVASVWGWRAVFLLLGCTAGALLCLCYACLSETQPVQHRTVINVRGILGTYARVFASGSFQRSVGAVTLCLAAQFLTIAGAPFIIGAKFRGGETDYWLLFLPITVGIFLGGLVASRVAGRLSVGCQVSAGASLMALSLLADACVIWNADKLEWWIFWPYTAFAWGMMMLIPLAYGRTLDEFPRIAGTVASCQLFAQSVAVAGVSSFIVPILQSYSDLLLVKSAFVCLAIVLWAVEIRKSEKR